MPFIETLAQQGAGSLLGIGLQSLNDARQIRQQGKLNRQQLETDKKMTDYQFQKQLEMWRQTNFSAQVAELQRAGLNPGLIYGMSGAGGATTGGGAASSKAANAPAGGGEIMGMMNTAQTAAQIELTKAQAENVKADTEKKRGVDTELGKTQIASLTQGIENQKAQESLTKIQTNLSALEEKFKTEGYQANIHRLKYETNIALQQMQILQNEGLISENTWSTKIEMIQNEAAGIILRNMETEGKIQLQQAQIDEIIQSIRTQIKQLQQTDRSLNQKDQDIIIDQERNRLIEQGIWVGAATQVIGNVVDILKKGRPINNTTTNTTTNTRNVTIQKK